MAPVVSAKYIQKERRMSVRGFVDAIYAYRLVMLMGKPFTSWTAYKLGLIDQKGNVIRPPETPREKTNYTKFHSIVRTIKQTVAQNTANVGPLYLAVKSAWKALREDYNVEMVDIKNQLVTESLDSTDLDRFIMFVEMVSGDCGGDANAIASGTKSGPITDIGPTPLKVNNKKKKDKATL